VSCDLGMRDVRNSRHTLLIEKCRQLDPRKVADPDKMRVVGKMFVKVLRAPCDAQTCGGRTVVKTWQRCLINSNNKLTW